MISPRFIDEVSTEIVPQILQGESKDTMKRTPSLKARRMSQVIYVWQVWSSVN
jgi:hypothetical protein